MLNKYCICNLRKYVGKFCVKIYDRYFLLNGFIGCVAERRNSRELVI